MATVQSILDKAELLLIDETNIHWSETELLGWLNDAYKVIVKNVPQSSVKRISYTGLTANKPDQALPSDAIVLLGMHYNTASGKEVSLISNEALDSSIPSWYTQAGTGDIKHYVYSSLNPKLVWLYPNPTVNTSVEISYSFVPESADTSGNCLLDDTYITSIIDYILYRAYLKDSQSGGDSSRATVAYQAFLQTLIKE